MRRFFGGDKRKKVADDLFEKSTFYKATQYEECYWLTNPYFEPENRKIERIIYGNEITAQQRDFYLEVVKRYRDLKGEIERFINAKVKELGLKAPEVILEKDIELVTIIIPQINSKEETEWEIDYLQIEGFTTFEVELKNWLPFHLSFSA